MSLSPTLASLAAATDRLKKAKAEHENWIAKAIEMGHSERAIGRAAGLSGVAIHNRKTPGRGATENAAQRQEEKTDA